MTSEEPTVIKVAYLIDTISCDTSGTEKQLLEIIRRLDRTRFSPYLICLYSSSWLEKNDPGCPYIVLGYRGFLKTNFPCAVKKLATMLSTQRVDILQTFFEDSIFVAFLAAKMVKPSPCLLSSRRDIGLGHTNQPWYHRLYPKILPWVNKGFHGIITNSKQVRQYSSKREKTVVDKYQVIYNGVDLPPANQLDPPDIFASEPQGLWLIKVASLTPVKRHDVLIKALGLIHHELESYRVHCIFLGEGPKRSALELLVEQEHLRNVVHFVGAVPHVYNYLTFADIGILCSDREGLSNAILEYMAAGLPVVATAVGGNIELITDQNGFLVPPADSCRLAQALSRLIRDRKQRQAMGDVARKIVQKHFSWERSLENLGSFYETLVQYRENNYQCR